MVTAIFPFAIVLGVIGTIGLAVFALWERVERLFERFAGNFSGEIERADLHVPLQRIGAILAVVTVVLWLVAVVIIRPGLVIALLFLPVAFGISGLGFRTWIARKVNSRLKAFNSQLELVLRLIANGLRVGLSLRQALVLVLEESPDPARTEFQRVIARTNIGVTMDAALSDMVRRVPSEELQMLVDAIEVQSKTGGNLAKILDHLASTIKSRRMIARKVAALTGEAKASGWVIGLLPIFIGVFIMTTQPLMREALFNTTIGHMSLVAFVTLEGLGALSVRAMMKLDI